MRWRSAIAIGILALLAGCSNYYAVQDDGSGATYYTRHVTQFKDGSVTFVDSENARDMTLSSASVTAIPEQEYNDRMRTSAELKQREHEVVAVPAAARISPDEDLPRPMAGSTTRPSDQRYRTTGIPDTPADHDQTYRESTRQNKDDTLVKP